MTSTLANYRAYNNGGYFDPAYKAAGFHELHHRLYALGQLHLSRLGQPVDSPLLQWPAVHGRLHLQPRHRRFHGRSVQHVHDAAPSAEDSQPGLGPLQFGARSPSSLHLQVLYNTAFFKHSKNWALKNIVGNWEFAPIYTYQTGTWYTVQSGVDSNLNGDSGRRPRVRQSRREPDVGCGTTALKNSAGETVAYLANNPNARYMPAPKGALPTARPQHHAHEPDRRRGHDHRQECGRLTEKYKLQFSARFFNIFNHPQYVGGYISDVAPIGLTSAALHNYTEPPVGSSSSRPRRSRATRAASRLALKFIF